MTDPQIPIEPGMTADELAAAIAEEGPDPRSTQFTPKLALPYPQPTDPVAQGAANIQALATAVDNAKLFGPVAQLTANASLRRPAAAGEIALITFSAADWHSHPTALCLAAGTMPQTWQMIGTPTFLYGNPAAFAIANNVSTFDPEIYFDIPTGIQVSSGWVTAAFSPAALCDGAITPQSGNDWPITGSGIRQPAYTMLRPQWGGFSVRIGLRYFGAAQNITMRSIMMGLVTIMAP